MKDAGAIYFEGLTDTETRRRRPRTSYALISDLPSSPEAVALGEGFMQIEDRVLRRHIVKLVVTQFGASGAERE